MSTTPQAPRPEALASALGMVAGLIGRIRSEQWNAPTPCTEWSVRDVVAHLVGMNRIFTAILRGQAPPERGHDPLGTDPLSAYLESASALQAIFEESGALDKVYTGPLGDSTGAERMQIRIYDLLAHGWDLAQATGQPLDVPEVLAEQSLAFVRSQLPSSSRAGRFAPVQPVPDDAPVMDRLVAFLGRPVTAGTS